MQRKRLDMGMRLYSVYFNNGDHVSGRREQSEVYSRQHCCCCVCCTDGIGGSLVGAGHQAAGVPLVRAHVGVKAAAEIVLCEELA